MNALFKSKLESNFWPCRSSAIKEERLRFQKIADNYNCRSSRVRPHRSVVVIEKISVVSILIKQYRELSRLYIVHFININKELLYN